MRKEIEKLVCLVTLLKKVSWKDIRKESDKNIERERERKISPRKAANLATFLPKNIHWKRGEKSQRVEMRAGANSIKFLTLTDKFYTRKRLIK